MKKSFQQLSRCKECFQVIGKGINHTCNNANKKRNLELVVLGSNEATRESIASTVIKQKGSPKGEAFLLHTGGNKLRVSPGTSNSKVNRVTSPQTIGAEEMATIQKNLNLSEQVILFVLSIFLMLFLVLPFTFFNKPRSCLFLY